MFSKGLFLVVIESGESSKKGNNIVIWIILALLAFSSAMALNFDQVKFLLGKGSENIVRKGENGGL